MKRIYIAGRYSGGDVARNVRVAMGVAERKSIFEGGTHKL